MLDLKITVDGKAAPQGSKTRNRYGAVYESSKAVGPWRDAVRAEASRAMRERGLRPVVSGPVRVSITFRVIRPKSHYRTGRFAAELRGSAPRYPDIKPDGDKLTRAVLDGLAAGGVYHDDGQVVDGSWRKRYADRPGADIEVSEML